MEAIQKPPPNPVMPSQRNLQYKGHQKHSKIRTITLLLLSRLLPLSSSHIEVLECHLGQWQEGWRSMGPHGLSEWKEVGQAQEEPAAASKASW